MRVNCGVPPAGTQQFPLIANGTEDHRRATESLEALRFLGTVDSPKTAAVLLTLGLHGPLHLGELARRAGLPRSTTQAVVHQVSTGCRAKGAIRPPTAQLIWLEKPNPSPGHFVRAHLTHQGCRLVRCLLNIPEPPVGEQSPNQGQHPPG